MTERVRSAGRLTAPVQCGPGGDQVRTTVGAGARRITDTITQRLQAVQQAIAIGRNLPARLPDHHGSPDDRVLEHWKGESISGCTRVRPTGHS